MVVQTNAQEIQRIYKGEMIVYENFEAVWQPITLQLYDKNGNASTTLDAFYMEVDNRLIFKCETTMPAIYYSRNNTHPLMTLPGKYNNLNVISNMKLSYGDFGFTAEGSMIYCYGGNDTDKVAVNLSMLTVEFTK